MKKNLVLLYLITSSYSVSANSIYKDTGLAPDLCPVQNHLEMVREYMISQSNYDYRPGASGNKDLAAGPLPEPYTEGCHTLKTIYVSSLLSALEMNIGENKVCSFTKPNECTVTIGKTEVQKHYNRLVDYIKRTQKSDVKNALNNKEENVVPLIINQVQHLSLTRYGEGSSAGQNPSILATVNSNVREIFKTDLNLKGNELDAAKTAACMDYDFRCVMELSDPSRVTQHCKNVRSAPRPDYCSSAKSGSSSAQAAAPAVAQAPVVAQLTAAQADEYLYLNRDVLKAYETKAATDTRTKIEFASQHYHERSELEGRPRSVNEYLDCNPRSVGLGFYGPENSNTDEAKTDIKAFVEKHFRLLIQTVVPVSARNFKTFGCMDLTKYLACYSDVRKQCSQGLADAGGVKYIAEIRACAFDHYNSFGKKEGRDAVKMCN